jgi:hypothetical protein
MLKPASLALVALLAAPMLVAEAQRDCAALQGFDLFQTRPDSNVGLQDLGLPLLHFRGVPLQSYDFPGIGPRPVGPTDTIVERFQPATPTQPLVPVELVALQLQSVEAPSIFVTLQSQRAPGEPQGARSTGTLAIQFDPACQGGLFASDFTVAYDLRLGSLQGPILGAGLLGPFTLDRLHGQGSWDRVPDPEPLDEQGMLAAHGVLGPSATVPGVNVMLNGVDPSGDFHAGGP